MHDLGRQRGIELNQLRNVFVMNGGVPNRRTQAKRKVGHAGKGELTIPHLLFQYSNQSPGVLVRRLGDAPACPIGASNNLGRPLGWY
jgi:hypothetical protein